MMKKKNHDHYDLFSFVKIVLSIDVISLVLFLYPVFGIWGLKAAEGAFLGDFLTTANVIAGYYLISRYFEAPNNTFFKVVFGSMGARLVLMLVLVIAVLLLLKTDQNSFIISLFISYIYKSVIEMIFINKKSRNKSFSTNSGDDTKS